MVYVNNSDELYHYGVKGMRWGHRKDPTAYGGSITSNGKYKASNGVVIAKSRNVGVAAGRRFSTSLAGRGLAAVGSMGMNEKQKTALKKQQAALREYQKVGGDRMFKNRAKAEAKAAKKERKAAIKSTYKQLQKEATFAEKLQGNDATRKLAAKYIVDNGMTVSEAKNKAYDVAKRNTAIVLGAYGAIAVGTVLASRR